MAQTLVEMAKDLTCILVETGRLSAEEMQGVLQQTHAILSMLKGQEEAGAVPVTDSSPVDWRKSISKYAITCLVCGKAFKQLSIRHLGIHGLDGRSYRIKYGIPRTQPLAARSTTEWRRQIVQGIRPWEKAPTYLKGQTRDGHPLRDSDNADAVQAQIEEPAVHATTQPKRRPKTAPKKQAARKTRAAE